MCTKVASRLASRSKQAVAHRLALAARQMIYGEKIVFSGPRIVSASGSGSTLTVKCTC